LQFVLENRNGMVVRCINYGCRLTDVFLPSGSRRAGVVLGLGALEEYEADSFYLGALVGRYANRVRGASFVLSGRRYKLTQNDGDNYLHGSFHRRVFDVERSDDNAVTFSLVSNDGEDGFPGELRVRAKYELDGDNCLRMDYWAQSDAATHVNLTQHPYFDLSGGNEETVEGQLLRLYAGRYLEIGEDFCPTGRALEAAGGPFDFSVLKPIGRDIDEDCEQLKRASGYDHCFVLDRAEPGALKLAAEACDAERSRRVFVYTTQPGVQFYSGNFLGGTGRGRRFARRGGFCLETQRFPNSPNMPEFPSTLLRPGEIYHETTILKFEF